MSSDLILKGSDLILEKKIFFGSLSWSQNRALLVRPRNSDNFYSKPYFNNILFYACYLLILKDAPYCAVFKSGLKIFVAQKLNGLGLKK